MNYWIITDTHFGHDKMIEMCNRPLDFASRILENIKNTVKEEDVLIHLGDVCFYDEKKWNLLLMKECKGSGWLIKGNHDKKSNSWYLNHNWDFVADQIVITMFGERIALSHKPILAHSDFDINIHGHHHNTLHHPEDNITAKHKLLFIEHTYAPINLRKLVE